MNDKAREPTVAPGPRVIYGGQAAGEALVSSTVVLRRF